MHLNKPDTLNSLTVTMAREFEAALQQLQADTAARALIITGEIGPGLGILWTLLVHAMMLPPTQAAGATEVDCV
jgi:hypothetical protein